SYKLNTVPNYNNKPHYLRLPQDKIALFTSNEDKIYAYAAYEADKRERPYGSQTAVASRVTTSSDDSDSRYVTKTKTYKVKRGDNLSTIANRHNVSLSDLKKWNKLRSNTIAAGANLKIVSSQKIAVPAKKTAKTPVVKSEA